MLQPLALALFLGLQAGAAPSAGDRFEERLERERAAAETALAAGDRAKAALHFHRRGAMLCDREWYVAARADLYRAVREAVAAGARDTELEARLLLGRAERYAGDPGRALEEERIVLSKLEAGAQPELECGALYQAGDACFDLQRFEEARGFFAAMHATAVRAGLGNQQALAWAKLGLAYLHLGESGRAEESHEYALAIPVDAETADRVQLFRAKAFQMLGRHDRAAALLEELLDAKSAALRLDVSGDLALELVGLGRFEEGQRHFENARALSLELGLHANEWKFLLAFGNLDADRGDLEAARLKFEEALDRLREPHQAVHRGQVLLSLAGLRAMEGDPRAFDLWSEARGIGREACDRPLESKASVCLAGFHLSVGAVDLARRGLEEARLTAEAGDDLEAVAAASGTLAWLEWTEGRPEAAAALARESFDRYRLLGMDQQSLEVLDTVAVASLATSDEASLEESVRLARGIFDVDFLRASDLEERARFHAQFAVWAEHGQALVSLRLRRPDLDEGERARILAEGFAEAGEWKGRALLGGLARRRARPDAEERTRALARLEELDRDLLDIRQKVAAAHRTGGPPGETLSLLGAAETLRAERDELASRWREDETATARGGRTPEEVRGALGDDRTALVEYVAGAGRLQAYVLTRSDLALVDLGEREPIERRVAEFQSGLGMKRAASTEWILERAETLYGDLLAAPLRSFAERNVDQIVVVPTPALASLPFEALIAPSAAKEARPTRFGDADFLLRKYSVAYAPSAAVLVELSALAVRSGPSSVLMLVDPDYPDAAAKPAGGLNLMGRSFRRLVASREEGCAVARVLGVSAESELGAFESASRHTLSTERLLLLGGQESTPARFLAEAGKYAVIHVAAHGLADFEDPEQAALALSSQGSSDGFLTYRDVLRLPLAADLAVLSACDTGVGRPLAGEGVLSLARAFMLAGSRTVVASLWPVDDRQTGETMSRFYRHSFERGSTIPRALRQAKLDVLALPRSSDVDPRGVPAGTLAGSAGRLEESADPWFWAPFVSVGPAR